MAKYSHTDDEDDQITGTAYADDDDDDGWNHDNPTPTLDDPGVYRGRILADEGCIANLKPDGTGQVVFRIAPLSVVSAKLHSCTAEQIPATQQQRFSMFISRTSNRPSQPEAAAVTSGSVSRLRTGPSESSAPGATKAITAMARAAPRRAGLARRERAAGPSRSASAHTGRPSRRIRRRSSNRVNRGSSPIA